MTEMRSKFEGRGLKQLGVGAETMRVMGRKKWRHFIIQCGNWSRTFIGSA